MEEEERAIFRSTLLALKYVSLKYHPRLWRKGGSTKKVSFIPKLNLASHSVNHHHLTPSAAGGPPACPPGVPPLPNRHDPPNSACSLSACSPCSPHKGSRQWLLPIYSCLHAPSSLSAGLPTYLPCARQRALDAPLVPSRIAHEAARPAHGGPQPDEVAVLDGRRAVRVGRRLEHLHL